MAKNKGADKLVNAQLAQMAAQVANMAAQLEFQKERMRLLELPEFAHRSKMDIDRLAFDKAQAEWENAFKESSLTGTYQGQPTLEYLTNIARMTGVINGQQTLEGKLTDAQVAQINSTIMNTQRLTDLEYDRFGFQREQWGAEHQMALQDQQARLTGFIDGLPTFEREQWEANQGFNYLNLLSSLRGPENAFKMLEVLENSPEALQIMGQRWASQRAGVGPATNVAGLRPVTPQNLVPSFQPPSSQPSGIVPQVAPEMQSTMQGTSSGYQDLRAANEPMFPNYQMPGYTIDPPGQQANIQAYNYEFTPQGGTKVYPPGIQAPQMGAQASTQQAVDSGTSQDLARQALSTAPGNMVLPSQINAKEYNRTSNYGKQMGWAGYEAAGWDKAAAQEAFQRSLPKYAVGAGARGMVQI